MRDVCLVGWSQVSRYDGEPLGAWAEALTATGVPPGRIDSLDVLYCQSWPYDDPAARLAEAVGATPRRTAYSGVGGTTPLQLLGDAADRIARGRADVCAVVGGEALATVRRLRKAGERPAWSHRHPEKQPFPFEAPFHPAEVAHRVFQAYSTFALRDVARRAHLGVDVEAHRASLGALFAPMTEMAADNPHAWFPTRRTSSELVAVGPANRMVAYPYTKSLMAMMDVDQAAAFVLASVEAADAMGVRPERRVHVRGWAATSDPDYVAQHRDLWRSPGLAAAALGALERSGLSVDDVALLDLYSCFPSSVTFALDALGVAPADARAPFTVTGGLPYAGGPGSCYALTSVAAMADRLVGWPGSTGMVTAVGMHMSKHAAVVLQAGRGSFGGGVTAAQGSPGRAIAGAHEGPATVAAYTVHHGADGAPTDALLVCDVDPATRCYARATDPDLLTALESEEWVGRQVRLTPTDDVNVAVAVA